VIPALVWAKGVGVRLDAWLISIVEVERGVATMRLFTLAIYAWLAAQTLVMLPYADEMWGPDAFVQRVPFQEGVWYHWVTYLANHPDAGDLWWAFPIGQLAAIVLGLLGRTPRLAAAFVYLFTINLYHRAAPTADGGSNLSYLLLIYSIVGNVSGRAGRGSVRIGLANVAFWACRVQVVIVYFCASIFKLQGSLWQSGMALYYILQSDSFSLPVLHDVVVAVPALAMCATYVTLGFQLCFPTLIWFDRTRPFVIAVGIALHAGIALGMGLLFFGLIMLISYLLFIREETAARVLRRLHGAAPLRITWPEGARRLRRVLEFVDLRRSCVFVEGSALEVVDTETSETWRGPDALRRVVTHSPALIPLFPVVQLVWALGGLSLLSRRLWGAGPAEA
jgi:hypothetical protein